MVYDEHYPYLEKLSREVGITPDNLIRMLEIEMDFHRRILEEADPDMRKCMYKEIYEEVHAFYPHVDAGAEDSRSMDIVVRALKRELKDKSVLDIGCGSGVFLMAVDRLLPHKRLVGVDISEETLPKDQSAIEFVEGDIIDLHLDGQFDVVFSHQVLEHIAPLDLPILLSSIKGMLADGGKLIIMMPNRLFGPNDVTRIVDYTQTNRIPAMGTHLNESTYSEITAVLKEYGFGKFYVMSKLLPLPIIKQLLPSFRVNPSVFMFVERKPWLLNLIYRLRRSGKPVFSFNIFLVCEEVSHADR